MASKNIQKDEWLSVVPEWEKYSNKVTEVKYKIDPKDSDFQKVFKPFQSVDSLQPNVCAVNFDDIGVTATDKNILIHIKANTDIRGMKCYGGCAKLVKDSEFEHTTYPNYKKLLDALYLNSSQSFIVDVLAFKTFAEIVDRLNICPKDKRSIAVKIGNRPVYLSPEYVITCMTALLQHGVTKARAYTWFEIHKPIIFIIDKDTSEIKDVKDKSLVLLVKMKRSDSESELEQESYWQRNYEGLSVGITYDLETNKVLTSSGDTHEIDTEITKTQAHRKNVFTKDILKAIKAVIPKKSSLSILENACVRSGYLICTDLDVTFMCNSFGKEDGFYEVVSDSLMPTNVSDKIESFPKAPETEDFVFKINGSVFSNALSHAEKYSSDDKYNPILTGVHIKSYENRLIVEASNDTVLSTRDISNVYFEKDIDIIIPKKAIKVLSYLDASDLRVSISRDLKHVRFDAEKYSLITRVIDGRFPTVKSAIPNLATKVITISDKDSIKILNALKHLNEKCDNDEYALVSYKEDKAIIHKIKYPEEEYLYVESIQLENVVKFLDNYEIRDSNVELYMPMRIRDETTIWNNNFNIGKLLLGHGAVDIFVKDNNPAGVILVDGYVNTLIGEEQSKGKDTGKEKSTEKDKNKTGKTQNPVENTGEDFSSEGSRSGTGVLYEHFTPIEVAEVMTKLAVKHGFTGGNVLEPAAGNGRLLKYLSGCNFTAFELSKQNYKDLKRNFPKAMIYNERFETAFLEQTRMTTLLSKDMTKTWLTDAPFDLVISNPPFGGFTGDYKAFFKGVSDRYESFFIIQSLKLLKKGAIGVYLLPSLFLRNGITYNAVKHKIFELATLVDAYRLPDNIFDKTQIGTDILILKKK
jgi:hypothetical protein